MKPQAKDIIHRLKLAYVQWEQTENGRLILDDLKMRFEPALLNDDNIKTGQFNVIHYIRGRIEDGMDGKPDSRGLKIKRGTEEV